MMVAEDIFIVIAPSDSRLSPLNVMSLINHQSLNYHSLTKRGTLKMKLNALMYISFYVYEIINSYKTIRYILYLNISNIYNYYLFEYNEYFMSRT